MRGRKVGVRAGAFVEERALGVCAGAAGLQLGTNPDTVRAPSFSFISRDRLGHIGPVYFPGAPALVADVLSPWDRASTVARKVRQYLAAGARLVWVIDPEDRTVNIYRADGSVDFLGEDGVLDGEDVLPGFSLALTEIWI